METEARLLIDRNFPAMRLSLLYCHPTDKDKTLAAYGLMATVEECQSRASDPLVARAKLGWWLEETRNAGSSGDGHPLTRYLQNSGALSAWPEALMVRLFTSSMNRIDAVGLNNEDSLKELCASMGLIQLELESALCGLPRPDHALIRQFILINGMMQLFRENFSAKQSSYYWLPLTLCAQFGITRQQVADQPSAEFSGRLFASIIETVMNGLDQNDIKAHHFQEMPRLWLKRNRHWVVLSHLQQRQLSRLRHELAQPGMKVENLCALQRMAISDGWYAWRIARQLDRI